MARTAPARGQVSAAAGQLLEALALADAASIGAVVTAEVAGRTPSFRFGDRASLLRGLGAPTDAFDQVSVAIEEITCEGTQFVIQWELEARHARTLRVGWAEFEATGRRVSLEGVLVGSTNNDLISAFSLYHDEVRLFEQLAIV